MSTPVEAMARELILGSIDPELNDIMSMFSVDMEFAEQIYDAVQEAIVKVSWVQ